MPLPRDLSAEKAAYATPREPRKKADSVGARDKDIGTSRQGAFKSADLGGGVGAEIFVIFVGKVD